MDNHLRLRNTLNIVFMLLALVAMIGVIVCKSSIGQNICYGLALLAVIIKIIEVFFRMPGLTRKTQYEQRRHNQRGHSGLQSSDSAEQ